jgi:hypothetical protein
MKIYRFNQETGVYLGEDFADEAPLKRGAFVVPPDATAVAPPQVEAGQILVFDAGAQRWEVRPQSDCRNRTAAR